MLIIATLQIDPRHFKKLTLSGGAVFRLNILETLNTREVAENFMFDPIFDKWDLIDNGFNDVRLPVDSKGSVSGRDTIKLLIAQLFLTTCLSNSHCLTLLVLALRQNKLSAFTKDLDGCQMRMDGN